MPCPIQLQVIDEFIFESDYGDRNILIVRSTAPNATITDYYVPSCLWACVHSVAVRSRRGDVSAAWTHLVRGHRGWAARGMVVPQRILTAGVSEAA